ncbi:MAG: hypothetical protein JXL84_13985 [Deltaproteobacteria bacterium]|nr:hypothetical protein [Deltaproteobacteria bacterium]
MFLCIFLPPICYGLTLQVLERYLQGREFSNLNRVLVRNLDALYQGRYTVQEEITRNVRDYLKGSIKRSLGISTNILVKTRDDRILYPSRLSSGSLSTELHPEAPHEPLNYVEVASENFNTLNDGLVLSVDVKVRHNAWLSNSILLFCVLLSLMVLQRAVKRKLGESEEEEEARKRRIEQLTEELSMVGGSLREVEVREAEHRRKILDLSRDKALLSKDIDGLLEEVERQEAGLQGQIEMKAALETEILHLKEELSRAKEKVSKPKQRKKPLDSVEKRFRVLYKNLKFTDRAVEGFLSLTEEYQLKAEELIHRLNEDASLVSVKRKVFGKGGKMDILEADFAYSGRLYYQKEPQSTKIRIVAIGTKNTQERDLAYLESVK